MSITLRQRLRLHESALRIGAIDRAAHVFSRVRYAMPDAQPRRWKVDVVRDVVYGPTTHAAHRLDVYVPHHAARPLPTVMYVHGGGFAMLSKETHRVMAMAFARRGYLVFNINYRLGRKNVFPAPLEDAAEALVWVHRRSASYGGDPERIAVAGESAGGNLVAALALTSSVRRPEPYARRMYDANVPIRAVVCTYPFLDMRDIDGYMASPRLPGWIKGMLFDAASSYVGNDVFRVADAAPLASPLALMEDGCVRERPLPPFFLSVGTRDPLLDHSRRMKRVLDSMGVPCELLVAPGEVHGYDAMVWRPAARAKWAAAHAFLAKYMGRP